MRIKIAQVITRLDWGGAPEIFVNLCKHLDVNLFELHIFVGKTLKPTEKTQEFLKRFSCQITFIPELVRDINPLKDILAFVRLFLLLRRKNFDIVHTHTAKAGLIGRLAARLAGVPKVIHTPHGHNLYGYFNPVLSWIILKTERLLTFFTDMIVALTEVEKNELNAFGVVALEKIVVIRQGLDPENFEDITVCPNEVKKALGICPEAKVVGVISRLEPVKGILYFVRAQEELLKRNSNIRFIICGEGSQRKKIESEIRLRNLQDVTIMTGWLDDIRPILSILDVLVLPSLNEAVGIVLIQAQAQGIPVVASRVGGIPEVVNEGVSGLLVAPKDSLAMAQAIIQLLDKRTEISQRKQLTRQWLRQRYELKNMINLHVELYRKVFNEKTLKP